MQTKVKGNQMLQSVEDSEKMKAELNTCISELAQIRTNLADLSSLEQQMNKIRQIEDILSTEKRYCILFANTISNIYRLYETNETKLVDYSEMVRRMVRRESFSNQSLGELGKIFHKVLL